MQNLIPMYKQKEFETIIAIDIETSSKGELLDCGFYTVKPYADNVAEFLAEEKIGKPNYKMKDGEEIYATFDNWETLFHYLLLFAGNVRVIAHNGFGFDFIGFAQWFFKNRSRYNIADDDVTLLSSESLIVALIIKTETAQYSFLDTMRFFPGQSLQKLAESFLGESKDDVPEDFISRMEDYKNQFYESYHHYLRRDCELLYRIYCEFRREINEFTDIGELGMSSGSTAMRSFRRWLNTSYPRTRIFSAPEEYLGVADYAMRGGLTLYIGDGDHNQHLYENVNHYDVISMYPSVMRSVPVPASPMIQTNVVVKDFDTYRPGWYLCNYEQMQGRLPILFPIESEYPQWNGQAVLSHFELQFLDRYGKYEILDGIVYDQYLYPFKKYFDELLELRMDAKRNKLDAKSFALKILANSLYGKFGQKASREIIAITSDRDYYETFLDAQLRDYDDSGVTEYAVTEDYIIYGVDSLSSSFSNRFIGAMVTSLARLKLGVILNTVHSIYCDTDSIFSQDEMASLFVGNLPGDFEKDSLSPASMICLGKKSYQYADDIKFKGIPSKKLTSRDMNEMRFDFEKEIEYKSPTAWRTAMKNNTERPNEFLPKSRRVSRGKSLAETGLLRTDGEFFDANEVKEFLDSLLNL